MNTLKTAVAGLGRIGKIHLNNLSHKIPDVEVAGVMDIDSNIKALAGEFGIRYFTGEFDELLRIPGLDAVIICSPTDTHADYVEKAARAGKHIFCEKPLDLNLKRVEEVLKTVQECEVSLMPGFNRRFDPDFMKVHKMVSEGVIGDVHIIRITSRDPAPPPLAYIERSGGIFLDMTIHDFDMARFISGKRVSEIYARGNVFIDPAIQSAGDIDTAVILITFEDLSMAVIDNSRKAVYGYDQRLEVFGMEGMLQADNQYADNHRLYNAKGISGAQLQDFFLERYEKSYVNEMIAFTDSLIRRTQVPVGGPDGLMSLVMGLAAKTSLLENRPVKISELYSGDLY